MTHQSKLSSPMEIAHEPIVKQHLSLPLALAILALGLMVGVFATQLSTAENNNEVNRQRTIEAEAARYTSLGMFYAAGNEAQAERVIEAEAARYADMAKFYLDQAKAQHAIEADAARYRGLAELYLPENAANGQRALEAESARYSGMAEFYLTENLAWPSRPTQFQPSIAGP
ncbi:MAG: hypothetical protein KJ077_14695 [Anaerolineae bacterium]|nr:hypothetical protein [Anaerolineae bacterium]